MKKIFYIILAVIFLAIAVLLLFFSGDAKNPYGTTTWGRFSGECATSDIPSDKYGKDFHDCDYTVPAEEIPKFKSIDFPFTNKFDGDRSLPLMASAMIDVNNDGVDEVFIGGGVDQADAIFRYTPDGFVDISDELNLPQKTSGTTTFGASSVDLDKDGSVDLVVTGDYGVLWYRNNNLHFEAKPIEVPLNDKSNAATTTFGDFDNDGHLDMFVSAYIKLDRMEGQTIFKDVNYGASSLLLRNNGDNTFTDITESSGLGYVHNTFQAVFVDIDKNGRLDLVVAYDTGEVRTYRNKDGSTFEMMPNPMTGKYGYPMGIAVGDYNSDGLVDFFFSNTGSSVPSFMARGDLSEEDVYVKEWMLFRNEGNFLFSDVAQEVNVADFEFSWGAIFEDFNLDGRPDLVVAENYVAFPPHKLFKLPGRFLLQREDGRFAAVEDQAGVVNKNYAITPLTSDFNQDGYPDLIFANLDGSVKAFINEGGTHNYIAVRLPEHSKYIGATVTVLKTDGTKMSDVYVIGEGLSSDQSSTLTFGLGKTDRVISYTLQFPNGIQKVYKNPQLNVVHRIGN